MTVCGRRGLGTCGTLSAAGQCTDRRTGSGTKETPAPPARASAARAPPALGRGGTLYSRSPGWEAEVWAGRQVRRETAGGSLGAVVSRVTAGELQASSAGLAHPGGFSVCSSHS